jgi:hypothetical protein
MDSGLLREYCALFIAAAQDYVAGPGALLALAGKFQATNSMIAAEALSLLALKAGAAVVDDLPLLNRLGGLAENLEGAGGVSMRTFVQAWCDGEPRALEAAARSLSGNRQFAHAALCYAAAADKYEARSRGAASRRASLMAERLRAVIDSGDVPPLGWLPGPAGR